MKTSFEKISHWFSTNLPYADKIAKWLNFEGLDPKTNESAQAALADHYDYFSLQDLLHYESYDPASHVFINKRSMGFGLVLTPSTGSNEEFVEILSSILTEVLPQGGHVQFLLWASPKIGNALDGVYESTSKRGGPFEALAAKQRDYLKKGAFQSLTKQHDFILRDFSVYLFFSVPNAHKDANIESLIQLREDTMNSLRSINLASNPLQIQEFMSLLKDLLGPNENLYPNESQWNQYDAISQQITNTEQLIGVDPHQIFFQGERDNWSAASFSVEHYPKVMNQWKMGEAIGQLFNSSLQIPCPYLINFTVYLTESAKANTKVQTKIMGNDSKANSNLVKWLPSLAREHQDWKFVRERLSEGDKLVSTFYEVILFAKQNEMSRATRKLKDLYQGNGWKLRRESYLQLQSFLAAMPMMMSEGLYQDLKRFGRLRTMTAFNAANIAPLQGEWKGYQKPLLMLPGRRGQITWWDPFANTEGNYNSAITAKSRSGKSVFVQAYIAAMVGSGGRCWVIDVGHSYEKTCKLLEGEFVEFSFDSPICINPFTAIKNFEEALPMLIPLLGSMARPKSETSEEEDAYLEKAIVGSWETHGNRSTITTVKDQLLSMENTIAINLAHLLVSYSKNGMYAMFFEGESNINMDNPLIVFELLGLKNKKELQRIVLLVLMAQIHHAMYLGERAQYKSCIIDEAWDLFGEESGGAAKFIETGYRTSARHNGNFISITQSINDYYKSASSIAAFENSDIKVILAQNPESIEQVKKESRFHLDPFLERLLKSVKKVEGAYSECVIRMPDGYSVHRIVLNPYTRILFSSKGDEFEAVKKLEKEGVPLKEAVEMVARQNS